MTDPSSPSNPNPDDPNHDDHHGPTDPTEDQPSSPASDAELIETACTGDTTAYGTLFARHESALRRMAQCLLGHTAEDLVLFAYTHGFDVLRSNDGPSTAIRPYLLRAMMQHCTNAEAEAPGDEPPSPTDNQTVSDLYEQTNLAYRLVARNTYPPFASGSNQEQDPADEEQQAALNAAVDAAVLTMYEDMADDWRLVIWHGEVERESPDTLALLLGIRTEEAYVLRHRARYTMRQFAVSQYLASARPARCRYAVDRLEPYDAAEIEPFEAERVAAHLNECTECAMLYEQVRAIASRLPQIIAHGYLGDHVDRYLTRSTKRQRRTGWAAVRWSRFRTALRHRNRGQTLGAFGIATTVVAAAVGGMLAFQPDVTSRPTPTLDADPWTPLEFPVVPSSYGADDHDAGDGSGRARTNPEGSSDARTNEGFGYQDRSGAAEKSPSESSGPTLPGTPSDPSPSDPSDPPTGTPTDDPTNTPTDDPTSTPTDDPTNTPTDDPTNTPTDDPTNTPTDDPTNTPTDDPTSTPTDDPTSTPTDGPPPSESPTPSFLPA